MDGSVFGAMVASIVGLGGGLLCRWRLRYQIALANSTDEEWRRGSAWLYGILAIIMLVFGVCTLILAFARVLAAIF